MSRIRELRIQHGYSQQRLADVLYVNQTAVSQWERDATCPEQPMLIKLAALFDVSTDYLLGLSDIKKPPESEIDILRMIALTRTVEDMSPVQFDKTLDFAKLIAKGHSPQEITEAKEAMEILSKLNSKNYQKAKDHLEYLLARQAEEENYNK